MCLYQEGPFRNRIPQSAAEWKDNLTGQTFKNYSLVQEELQMFLNIKTQWYSNTENSSILNFTQEFKLKHRTLKSRRAQEKGMSWSDLWAHKVFERHNLKRSCKSLTFAEIRQLKNIVKIWESIVLVKKFQTQICCRDNTAIDPTLDHQQGAELQLHEYLSKSLQK